MTILGYDGLLAPCVYLDHPSSISYNSGNILDRYINVEDRAERGDEGKDTSEIEEDLAELDPSPLDLTLVIHDLDCCFLSSDRLERHLDKGAIYLMTIVTDRISLLRRA